MKTMCADCYFAALVGLGYCPKHGTAADRAEFERRLTELAMAEHPTLKMLHRSRP